jgi:hypothetical protein
MTPPQEGYVESDPIGLAGGSHSTYAYVGGDPLDTVEPSGLDWHHVFPQANYSQYSPIAQSVSDNSTIETTGSHGWSTGHAAYNRGKIRCRT